jgi:hypothetical protein
MNSLKLVFLKAKTHDSQDSRKSNFVKAKAVFQRGNKRIFFCVTRRHSLKIAIKRKKTAITGYLTCFLTYPTLL